MIEEKNVLIIGANFVNKGAEAMLLTVVDQLKSRNPELNFYFICKYYEKDLALENGLIPIYEPKYKEIIKTTLIRVVGKLSLILLNKYLKYYEIIPLRKIIKMAGNINILIDISGYAYGDYWGKKVIKETIKVIEKTKAKAFFLPQAWGPFDTSGMKTLIKKMLNLSEKFYCRDITSKMHISKALEINQNKINLSPDIAFMFDRINTNMDLALDANKKYVGICPNMRIYEKFKGEGLNNPYLKELLNFIKNLLNEYNVILIPNEIRTSDLYNKDDRFLCSVLYENLNEHERSVVVWLREKYFSASQIKYLIENVDILIGSRFHSLVFALSLGKPTIALSWSHKYGELLNAFSLGEYVLEAEDISSKILLDKFRIIMKNKKIHESIIKEKLKNINIQLYEIFEEINVSI